MKRSCSLRTAVLRGVEALPVTVEVDISGGIPGITIVGMPDAAVLEARSRVRCALRSAGYEIPRFHVTVNLAPAELKKTGTSFDLPIALGILIATGQASAHGLENCLVVGELGLDGSVCAVRGEVAYGMLARRLGLELVTSADGAGAELADACVRAVRNVSELRHGLSEVSVVRDRGTTRPGHADVQPLKLGMDFSDVVDQELPKRALVLAAAGEHGVLMVGPPGAGKTMLAKRLPTILPPLGKEEQVEALLIHSVAGQDLNGLIAGERPFRSPHHSISLAGLVGGGRPVLPGEVSLAHRGVLFLDELPEFANNVLQSLRQPIEEHLVRIARADGTYVFPSRFLLVAAANPCPCGYLGDPDHACRCKDADIAKYQSKLAGPLIDRIDIVIDVTRPSSTRVIEGAEGLTSAQMGEMVETARAFRAWRLSKEDVASPAEAGVIESCNLSPGAVDTFEELARNLRLGGRAIHRVAWVARTVADLSLHDEVQPDDIVEAAAYRSRT